jgi:hypothetical protein
MHQWSGAKSADVSREALWFSLCREGDVSRPSSGGHVYIGHWLHSAFAYALSKGRGGGAGPVGPQDGDDDLDQYGHLFPDDLDDVADKMDDLVSGCAQNVPTKETGQGESMP